MTQASNRVILDVHLLLVRGSDVLLTQRRGGYGAGLWHLPSGKAEAGESVTDAVIREAAEEVGVTVQQDDLKCVHAVHVHHIGEEPRVGFFFEATLWTGEPVNREPDKCSDVRWFPLAGLPDGVIPYPAAGITGYLTAVPFSILGWGSDTPRPASPPLCPLVTTGRHRPRRRAALRGLLDEWDVEYGPVPAEHLAAARSAFAELDAVRSGPDPV